MYQKKEHGKESKMDKNNVSSSNKPEKEQKQLKNLHTHVLLILKFSRRWSMDTTKQRKKLGKRAIWDEMPVYAFEKFKYKSFFCRCASLWCMMHTKRKSSMSFTYKQPQNIWTKRSNKKKSLKQKFCAII